MSTSNACLYRVSMCRLVIWLFNVKLDIIAIIKSKVDISSFNEIEKSRPMQGQSPYVFNAGLQYMNKDNGWAVSTNINRVGNRIAISGNDNNPSIWEKVTTSST